MEKEELIAMVRVVAARRGVRRLRLTTFTRATGMSSRRVYDHFESWPALCAAAGLEPRPPQPRVPEEEIFAAMHDCFLRHGGVCSRKRFVRESRYSEALMRRRFATWPAALGAFRRWARQHAPGFPHMAALDARLGSGEAWPPAARGLPPGPSWPARGGRTCGEPLAFRALLFAPVNEQGVVLLFGMVAAELGYAVETVAASFPDCTARRRVAGGRWESVRIEFEFRSRSFREHGHDAAGCDVIVCWEHDWADCPLEVLALRPAIGALPARG